MLGSDLDPVDCAKACSDRGTCEYAVPHDRLQLRVRDSSSPVVRLDLMLAGGDTTPVRAL